MPVFLSVSLSQSHAKTKTCLFLLSKYLSSLRLHSTLTSSYGTYASKMSFLPTERLQKGAAKRAHANAVSEVKVSE